MPLTEVQQVNNGWDQADTKTISFTQTTEGNLLVLAVVSDALIEGSATGQPSGWTRLNDYQNGQADVRIFARLAPAGTYTSQTITAGGDTVAAFWEFSGNVSTAIGDCIDQTATGGNTTANSGTTGTTAQADELAIVVIGAGGNASGTWSAWTNSFVEEADIQSPGGAGTEVSGGFASRALTATGTYSTSATYSGAGSDLSGGVIGTFKASAGGVNGTGLGAFTFGSTAVGVPTTPGTAAAALTFTGAASGTPETFGTASGAYSFTAAASGSSQATVTGTGLGAFTFGATVTGAPETFGSGQTTLSFTGTASGVPDVQGTAAASVTFTAAATGNPDVQGQGVAALTFTGTAIGQVEGVATGTGLGAYTFTATAAGVPDVQGAGAGTFMFGAVATGVRGRLGQAVTTVAFAGVALGATRLSGQGVATLVFAGAASGTGSGDTIPDPNPLHASYRESSHRGTYRDSIHAVYQEGS